MLPEFVQSYADTPALKSALKKSVSHWQRDIRTLNSIEFFTDSPHSIEQASARNADALIEWQKQDSFPSLCAMVWVAFDAWNLSRSPFKKPALMAALLGEEGNALPYHNNTHFRKVLLQTIRLIDTHNDIYAETPRMLSEAQIALIIIAACIHDYTHDGKGNFVRGTHKPGKLEAQAFESAKPYLKRAGLKKTEDLDAVKLMLLTTDVTPLSDPSSYMNQLKSAFQRQFNRKESLKAPLNLSPDLCALESSASLCEMAMLLHEADVATSAGIQYNISQYETKLFLNEIGGEEARPEHLMKFMDEICERKFLTDAAQKLYGANMARIYALAEKDFKAGNKPYLIETTLDQNKTANSA